MTKAASAVRLVAFLLLAPALGAEGLPPAAPEAVGLSSARLQRLSATIQRYVDQGKIAGAVTLVARNGQRAQLQSFGKLDLESGAPMRTDSIFRIASMSKAITSVAVMLLQEEGRLLIADPVSRYIPAFAKTTVAVPPPADVPVVPAKRAITIRDLLTHTAGVSYGGDLTREAYHAAGFDDWYFADKNQPIGFWVEKLAALPMDAQPGERWVYGYSTDILGYLVERVSGQSLDEFFRTRIFQPLQMNDTHFFLPEAKRARLATVYAAKPEGGIERATAQARSQGAYVDGPRACFSGGAGLVSTASDYARFLQMLLNGGELDGVRLVSPKTVELMTVNHVGALYDAGRMGFGLGFQVVEELGRAGRPGSVGEFGWGGAYYTTFWVDPRERIVAVFLAQLLPSEGLDLQGKFRALVYQAVERSATWPARAPSAAAVAR